MIEFYKNIQGDLISDNDLVLNHNGFTGGADYITFYLMNNNSAKIYENVSVDLVINKSATNDSYTYKLYHGEENLSLQEWNEIETNDAITINELVADVYHKITARVFLSANQGMSEVYKDGEIDIQVSATESDV
jgi:hypothetical protein